MAIEVQILRLYVLTIVIEGICLLKIAVSPIGQSVSYLLVQHVTFKGQGGEVTLVQDLEEWVFY